MPCPSDISNISNVTGHIRSKIIFYPAQFWQHKNHIRLVHAFGKFILENSHGSEWSLHLIGGDRDNNLIRVKNLVKNLGIESHVFFPGFLQRSELLRYYLNSHALIYPTLLGPDNIPPLEAVAASIFASISNLPGHVQQTKSQFHYHDPLSVSSICHAIHYITSLEYDKDTPDYQKQLPTSETYLDTMLNFTLNNSYTSLIS